MLGQKFLTFLTKGLIQVLPVSLVDSILLGFKMLFIGSVVNLRDVMKFTFALHSVFDKIHVS